jgi:hypothetical protein
MTYIMSMIIRLSMSCGKTGEYSPSSRLPARRLDAKKGSYFYASPYLPTRSVVLGE